MWRSQGLGTLGPAVPLWGTARVRCDASGRSRHPTHSPPGGRGRWRSSPLLSQPENLRPPNIPAPKNLALTCGVWWAGSVQAIKADPEALLAPE